MNCNIISLHISCYSWPPIVSSSIVFYWPPCPATSTLWYNWIISTLNSSFFSIYTFSFFNTKSFFICYLSPCNIFTFAFFVFSTTLTTSWFLLLAFFLFFLLYLLQVLLLLLLLSYEYIIPWLKSDYHCPFLLLLSSLVIY